MRALREEVVRYEWERPGELVHVDVKRLGRIVRPGHCVSGDHSNHSQGAGWQYLYVAIDDHSRLAFASVYPDEASDSSTAFLEELVGFYGAHGIDVERVLSDNGACFRRRWAEACASHGIAVKKTRAYRPQTNGKAERSIRTLLERWAYAYPARTSPSDSRPCRRRSTSTIASVHTALSKGLRRCSASTTSLGHTASARRCALVRCPR